MNRDYVKAETPEMVALLEVFDRWDPVIYVDLHTTDGAKFEHDVAVIVAPVGARPDRLDEQARALSAALQARLTALGHLPLDFYPAFVTDDPASGFAIGDPPPRFSSGYAAARDRLGILVETHSWRTYRERAQSTRDTLIALLERAATDAPAWRTTADEAAVAAKGNPATVMWEPDLVEALHQAGRTAEALERLEAFEARATAANNQRGLGAAARCRGQLLADDAASDAAFAASIEHYRPAHPVGMGRTWLAWGERLAASGRRAEAVERLERALHHLDEAGAGAWAARAAALLEEVGAGPVDRRPPLVDLAPEVAEVALLTAAGFDVDKVANHVLASRRTVLRLLADATAALGEHPGPGLLRHLGDASTLAPGDADDDLDADERPSATPPLAVVGTRALRVLGRFDVRDGGRDVTPPPGLGARLVKLLAVSGPAGVTVDEAVELLWPELDPAKGRTRLRNVLSRLRSTSGELVVRAGDGLRLADGVDVDLARFAALGAQAQRTAAAGAADAPALAKEALAIYGGDLLPDSPYEAWAAAPRERARRRVVDLLDVLARHHRASGRLDEAVAVVERAIAIDVYDEERYVFAAELRREQGRHGAAMALLQRARAVVADLGLAPSPRLVEVERSLRRPARPTD
jgi:DNA-binding SARP family transcriptional activator